MYPSSHPNAGSAAYRLPLPLPLPLPRRSNRRFAEESSHFRSHGVVITIPIPDVVPGTPGWCAVHRETCPADCLSDAAKNSCNARFALRVINRISNIVGSEMCRFVACRADQVEQYRAAGPGDLSPQACSQRCSIIRLHPCRDEPRLKSQWHSRVSGVRDKFPESDVELLDSALRHMNGNRDHDFSKIGYEIR